jgi:excisionase family DNA binding protein
MADIKKIYCEILEGVTFSDRCLFKLSKIIEGNKTCENCILRQLERIKSRKAEQSGENDIKATKDVKARKGINVTNDMEGTRKKRKRSKPRPKKEPEPIADAQANAKQMYSIQALSKLLGKSVRRTQELAKEGNIPGQKVGTHWEFSKEEIDLWLSEKKEYTNNVSTSSLQADQDNEGSSKPQNL